MGSLKPSTEAGQQPESGSGDVQAEGQKQGNGHDGPPAAMARAWKPKGEAVSLSTRGTGKSPA